MAVGTHLQSPHDEILAEGFLKVTGEIQTELLLEKILEKAINRTFDSSRSS